MTLPPSRPGPPRRRRCGRCSSADGVEAWHVDSDIVPLIALAFTFEGGAAQDPADKPGVAQMLARLLDEGAGPYNSDAFQERLAARAIELSFNAGPDALGGSLKTLVKHADEAFELLRLALAEPRFDDECDRARARPDHRGPALPGRTTPASWRRSASSPRRFPDHPTAARRPARSRASRRSRRDDLVAPASRHRGARPRQDRSGRRHRRRAPVAPRSTRCSAPCRSRRRSRRCRRRRSPGAARASSSISTCRNRSSASAPAASRGAIPTSSRPTCSTTSSAAAPSPRACSRRCARSAASPTASAPRSSATAPRP